MTVPGEPRLKEGTHVPEPITEISIVLDLFGVTSLCHKGNAYLINFFLKKLKGYNWTAVYILTKYSILVSITMITGY